MRHITDDERRARLARRHAIAPGAPGRRPRGGDPGDDGAARDRAADRLPLGGRAGRRASRSPTSTGAVRRPHPGQAARDAAHPVRLPARPAAGGLGERGGAGRRPGAPQDRQGRGRPPAWPTTARLAREARAAPCSTALGRSATGCRPRSSAAAVPELGGTVSVSPGTKWGGEVPIAPRVLDLARAPRARSSAAATPATGGSPGRRGRRWTAGWARRPRRWPRGEGYAELVRRWLRTFGPGTETDIVWWLGATKTRGPPGAGRPRRGRGLPRRWRHRLGAARRPRGRGRPVEPWAALLPVLDPTLMGWKQRDFYLDPDHTPYLFDTNGNGGTTAWWDGRVVGCWVQDDDRRGAGGAARGPGRGRRGGARRRGRAAHRLAGRRAGHQRLRLPPDEVRASTPLLTRVQRGSDQSRRG